MATDKTLPDGAETPPPSLVPDMPTVPPAATTPVVEGGVEVYNSSEEFQRAHAQGLAQQKADEQKQKATTEKQRIRAVLDKYIDKYGDTVEVKKMGEKNKKSADHNLDVAADVTEILRKIKNELKG